MESNSIRRIINLIFIPLLAAFMACISLETCANASDLPNQHEIFTIYNFRSIADKRPDHASVDLIFSALPLYRKLPSDETVRWTRDGYEQQGVIVLNDKSVLYFQTESSWELITIDPKNHFSAYRMPNKPARLEECPKYRDSYDQLSLPKQENIFCIVTHPWNKGLAFTPDSLFSALPNLTPSSIFPKDWLEAENHNEPLNGVIVLKNRAVLRFFAWSSSAITFYNYKAQTYFMTK